MGAICKESEDSRPAVFFGRTVWVLRAVMEVVLLLMVGLAPWAYGAVHPGFEFLLYAALGSLLALWGVRMILEGRLTWQKCPVALCLAGLFLTGILQTTPLPRPVLAWFSPSTDRLYRELLPSRREQLPGLEKGDAPAGVTLSLDPGATRKETFRLLAVFLLFAVVRNNLASAAAFRRLSVVALANAALLSLFGLVQFFTAPSGMLYWQYPTAGSPFGPFICRDHFPFYVNMGVGLGLGLLAGIRRPPAASGGDLLGWRRLAQDLLQNPAALWICAGLALSLSAVAVCLSRGGFVALLAGFAVWLLAGGLWSPRSFRLTTALLAGVMAVGLVSWFGFDRVEARLSSLWGARVLEEDRLTVWRQVAPQAAEFPFWGTGYGTFRHLERLTRTAAPAADLLWEHAHNDYLEILLEGGLSGLVLALVAIGLVNWLGCRALSRFRGRVEGGLALGGLFAFTTFVVHSGVDFGGHLPAIAVLATVVAAQLCGLSGRRASALSGAAAEAPGEEADSYRLRLGGLAPLLGCATAAALGILLAVEGWNAHRAEQAWQAAWAADDEEAGREERISLLRAAARLSPWDARLHADIGQVCLARFDEARDAAARDGQARAAAGAVLAWAGPAPAAVAAPSLLAAVGAAAAAREGAEEESLAGRYLIPGLTHYVRARDLCPLRGDSYLALAAHAERLGGDDRSAYLRRAKAADPVNPYVWYWCGRLEWGDEQTEQACDSWLRCLELSDHYLPDILDASSLRPNREDVAQNLLPARPETPQSAAGRRLFLEQALRQLEARPAPPAGPDLHLKAIFLKSLGRPNDAAAAYEELLLREVGQVEWRVEYAQLLYEQGRLQDARRELLTVLAQQPTHAGARALLGEVDRALARRG